MLLGLVEATCHFDILVFQSVQSAYLLPIVKNLLEKMAQKICVCVWSSRNISYAARVALINSVLISIHSYWSQIMVLPRIVLKRVNAICKVFLWKCFDNFHRSGIIAWDKTRLPKNQGDLGFRQILRWNTAIIGKYVWVIVARKDKFWVRWIHSVYLHNTDWWDYKAPTNSSWYWKCDEYKNLVDVQTFLKAKYSIKQGYTWLSRDIPLVNWHHEVWGRISIPKHQFILWLATLWTAYKLKLNFSVMIFVWITVVYQKRLLIYYLVVTLVRVV